jgi:hypothetical protein
VNAPRLFMAGATRALAAADTQVAAPANAGRVVRSRVLGRGATPLAALVCAWLALVFLTNPSGAFPLNDDWSYSRAVETLVDDGRLEFTSWTSMTLIAQVLWGALFCLPFGFSFLALRLSTVVLGAVGLIAAYGVLRELGTGRRVALLGAAAVGVNPLYFSLSLTFMTDVPFSVLAMLSILFLVRSLRTDAWADRAVGFTLAGAAVLIRQPGIVIPIAFAIAVAIRYGLRRKTLIDAFLPAGALMGVVLLYQPIARATIGLPQGFIGAHGILDGIRSSASEGFLSVPRAIGDRLWLQLIYLGLFVLPVAVVMVTDVWQRTQWERRRQHIAIGFMVVAALGGVVVWRGELMPLSGNVLFDLGLGPVLLRDTYLLGLPHGPTAPEVFWVAITAAAVLGSASLVASVWLVVKRAIAAREAPGSDRDVRMLFVVTVGVVYAAGVALATSSPQYAFFDRYVVFLLLPAIAIVCRAAPMPQGRRSAALSAGVVLVSLFGLFSVAGTHDYLAWNRARWQAVGDLARDGVPQTKINGGFEFNAWYGYDPRHPTATSRPWWIRENEYVVAFGPIDRYVKMRSYRYWRWLPFGHGAVFVLRRTREP